MTKVGVRLGSKVLMKEELFIRDLGVGVTEGTRVTEVLRKGKVKSARS